MKLKKSQKESLEKITKKHNLDFLVLFGSYANGKARADSDLDVATYRKEKLSLEEFGDVFSELSYAIPGQNIDLSETHTTEPLFLYEVLVKGRFIAGNKDVFDEHRAFAFKNFIDSKSLFDLQSKQIQKRQEVLNKALL